jgi:hypothetical protein
MYVLCRLAFHCHQADYKMVLSLPLDCGVPSLPIDLSFLDPKQTLFDSLPNPSVTRFAAILFTQVKHLPPPQ